MKSIHFLIPILCLEFSSCTGRVGSSKDQIPPVESETPALTNEESTPTPQPVDSAVTENDSETTPNVIPASNVLTQDPQSLLICEPSIFGRIFMNCVLTEKALTETAEKVLQVFEVDYSFLCTPGGNMLEIAVKADDTENISYLWVGEKGTATVYGKGPISLVDYNKERTLSQRFNSGCSLRIDEVRHRNAVDES